MGLALLLFLTSVTVQCIWTYLSQLLTAGYGLVPGTANLLVSAMLAAGAGTVLVGGALTDRVSPSTVALGGYAALAGLAALLATGSIPLALAALILPSSGTISVSRLAWSTLAGRLSERANLGKSFIVVTAGISLGGVVAPPAFGTFTDLAGMRAASGAVAVLGLLSSGPAWWLLGRVDGSARRPQATSSS